VRNRTLTNSAVALFLVLAAAGPAEARQKKRSMSVGFIGGINLSTFGAGGADVEGIGFSNRAGLVAGAFFGGRVANRVPLTIEALLSQKGATIDFKSFGVTGRQAISVSYVEVPVLVGLGKWPLGRSSILVEAGLAFSFKAFQRETFDGQTIDKDDRTKLKSTDVAVAFGARIDRRKLGFTIQYVLGLTDINDDSQFDTAIRNRTLRFAVRYSLK